MIKLKPSLNLVHGLLLHLQEMFILCHELGHYFNGDLSDEDNFVHVRDYNWEVFDDNKSHEMEFKADLTGFAIYRLAFLKKFSELPEDYLLIPLFSLFDIFAMITEGQSRSHPHPIARMHNILNVHYSPEIAQHYLESFQSTEKFQAMVNKLLVSVS